MKRYYLDLQANEDDRQHIPEGIGLKTIPFKTSNFPAGEVFFKLNTELMPYLADSTVVIMLNSGKSDVIMRLLMANDAIRRYDVKSVELYMPYVPYGRQDRVVHEGESLSIKVFAELINSCNFNKVIIADPHSSVTPALLDRCVIDSKSVEYFVSLYLDNAVRVGDTTVVAPDAGAEKRCLAAVEHHYSLSVVAGDVRDLTDERLNLVTAIKHRTPNGLSVTLTDPLKLKERVVIIDDICDGGRTFIELAKALKGQYGVKHITLLVTHGIFSAGKDVLYDVIDEVYCYNNMSSIVSFDSHIQLSDNLHGR
jgi:ribose-phosphate pyrophosphokinase